MVTKNLFSLAATSAKCVCLVVAVATALSLASCSDDDDSSSTGSSTAGLIETTSGTTLRINSVGSTYYDYEDGQLVGIDADEYFEVSHNPFVISSDDGDLSLSCSSIKVNGNGYITFMNLKESYEDDDESDSGSGSVKFSYDNNGHLTKVTFSASGSGKYTEDGETYSYSASISSATTFTWNGNLLLESTCTYTGSGKEAGYSWKEVENYTVTFENSTSYPNATYQYTPNITRLLGEIFDTDLFKALAYIGYLGKGPSYHPVGYDYEEEFQDSYDGEVEWEDENSYSYSCSYSLNSDGSVNYSSRGSSKTYFTYSLYGVSDDDDEVKTRASVKETPSSEEGHSVRKHRGLFGNRRHHLRSAESK